MYTKICLNKNKTKSDYVCVANLLTLSPKLCKSEPTYICISKYNYNTEIDIYNRPRKIWCSLNESVARNDYSFTTIYHNNFGANNFIRLRTISGEDNTFPLYFVPRKLMSLLYNLKFLSYTPLYTENFCLWEYQLALSGTGWIAITIGPSCPKSGPSCL